MSLTRILSALVLAAGSSLGIAGAASAADMPIKAPPPPPASPWVMDVHGSFDMNFTNTRVTGGGFLLYNTNSTVIQPSMGLQLDVYKNKATFINSFSVFGGIWNENITDPHGLQSGLRHWQEMDWWVGVKIGFAEHWNFSAQHLEFVFPSGGSVYNDVFVLGFDDSYLGFPITFNPYFQVFYVERGGIISLGKQRDTYRLEFGISPTYSFMKAYGIPLTISAPSWIEFGPTEAWNRNDGTTNWCGSNSASPCALSNLGYVSTGLQGKYTLESWVPKRLGVWYVKAGVQFFHITNQALLAVQATTTPGNSAVVATYPDAKKDVAVVSGGFGFSF